MTLCINCVVPGDDNDCVISIRYGTDNAYKYVLIFCKFLGRQFDWLVEIWIVNSLICRRNSVDIKFN